jgi:multicomponent K+:H+ antiporter subunit D
VQNGLFAALFFAAAIAMAGMPPLSGFLGKLLVLDAVRAPGLIGWAWSAILVGSFLTIVGFARAGSTLFWKSTAAPARPSDVAAPPPATAMQVAPVMLTLVVLAALAVFAGPVSAYLDDTSAQLFDREGLCRGRPRPGRGGAEPC